MENIKIFDFIFTVSSTKALQNARRIMVMRLTFLLDALIKWVFWK